jgi:hypothetical protein
MGAGCGAALGTVHPWRGEVGATLGGGARPTVVVLPYFSAEGGRRGRLGLVGLKAEWAGGAAGWTRPKFEEETFLK